MDVIGESGEEERRNLGGVYGLCACLSAALWGTVNFKITDAFSFMSVVGGFSVELPHSRSSAEYSNGTSH